MHVHDMLLRIRMWLPRGDLLTGEEWRRRRAMIVRLIFCQAAALPVMSLIVGKGLLHGLVEAAPVAALALVARAVTGRRGAVIATLGMTTGCAVAVHLSRGSIEAHFLYFVAVGLIALYQSWTPFLA